MSLRANIEHLAAAQGIVAVSVVSPAGPREFRGEGTWSPILDAALSLLDKTGEKTIRLVVGKHTIVLQTESEETVAVVLPTGHAIAKSLRRMIRRMSRKPRGPLVRPAAPAAASVTEQTTTTVPVAPPLVATPSVAPSAAPSVTPSAPSVTPSAPSVTPSAPSVTPSAAPSVTPAAPSTAVPTTVTTQESGSFSIPLG